MSAQPLDIRMAHLEGAYEQINERLGSMEVRFESRFDALDRKIEAKADAESVNRRFDAVDRRFDAFDKKFTALFVVVGTNTAAIVASVIAAIVTLHR
jgi:hypothetical protein